MENKYSIEGRWVSTMPHDSDDYLLEYIITREKDGFNVIAKDLQDGEEMEISSINWDGVNLTFQTLMPSTGRCGIAQFHVKQNGNIESKFTFTVIEELKKLPNPKSRYERYYHYDRGHGNRGL